MAADDEPRPRACGMALRQRRAQPRRLPAERVERPAHRAHHEVVLVEGHLSRSLACHLDDEPGAGQLCLELVTEVEGETERVEARPQVGRGGRHRDSRHQRSPAASAASVTSASTTDSTSGPNPSSAVAVSFSPWPVTVMTTVLPA